MCGCFTFLRIFLKHNKCKFYIVMKSNLSISLFVAYTFGVILPNTKSERFNICSNWKTQNTFSSCFCLFNMYGFSDNVLLFILILVICAFSFYLNLAKGLLVLSVICTVLVFPNKQQKSLWYLSSLLCAFLFNWFLHYIISILLCVYSLWFSFYNFLG